MLRHRVPGFIDPCLPSGSSRPPRGPGWLHEIKHDGYRLMVQRDAEGVRLLTRRGINWSDRFPLIASAAKALKARSFLIVGEAVACDANGLASFHMLRRKNGPAFLYAFDLIELDGQDLLRQPIEERKRALAKLLGISTVGLEINDYIDHHDGEAVFAQACRLGCEGIVSKRLGSRYESGRSSLWVKTLNPEAPALKRLELEEWHR
jgi:bifunctional non-homologous end joining protein LigD